MDRELEEQIDELIKKATKDLTTRISRVVIRHQNKLLKEKARDIKNGVDNRRCRKEPVTKVYSTKEKKHDRKDGKYHSDSDSDGYYSG